MSGPLRLDPNVTCDGCGCFEAYSFDGEALCADCYAGRGSCCSAEFSGTAFKAIRCKPSPASPPSPGMHTGEEATDQ
jgi:hypothetical protein